MSDQCNLGDEIITVRGKTQLSRKRWDELFRNAPRVDLRSVTPEEVEEMWRKVPVLTHSGLTPQNGD